jgi:eukaryotic-like serine/threonine-protein kinase
MTDRPSHNLDGLDINLARRIDEVCRRFEADWRARRQPRIEDYLGEVPDEGHHAIQAELEAQERELRPPEETVVRPESSPPTAPKPQAPNPATIDEAVTMAPGLQSTPPIPDTSIPAVHEEATLPPRDQATVDLGASRPVQPDASSPERVRYFGEYELLRLIARCGMGVVFQARQISLWSSPAIPTG